MWQQAATCKLYKEQPIPETAFIGLGGNLGPTLTNFQQALQSLQRPDIQLVATSRLYLTNPLSDIQQPPFLNAVCCISTSLNPQNLLAYLQHIEKMIGKTAKPQNAPRPIDLDLLFYGSHHICDPNLAVPHPLWMSRLFVLQPLSDIISRIYDPASKKEFVLQTLLPPLCQQKVLPLEYPLL